MLMFVIVLIGVLAVFMMTDAASGIASDNRLNIGWAQTDITPTRPAALGGMTTLRISTEVMDPLTATALVLEAPYQADDDQPLVCVGCDLRSISEELTQGVRAEVVKRLPGMDPMRIILNATHSHLAPPLLNYGIPVDAMEEPEYLAFAIPRIAQVIEQAWKNRRPGGISFGLSHAVIGHNRIMAYDDGTSKMGGDVTRPDFSHVEGYEDPATQVLYTWDGERRLTGVVVNIAVTAQVSQSLSVISADYWHDTRVELRQRLGDALFVLPQCSAAGDQMSRPVVYRRAEERMDRLTGRTRRQQLAVRLADAVTSILPTMREHVEWGPILKHRGEEVPLTRRILSERDQIEGREHEAQQRALHEQAMKELAARPELLTDVEWIKRTSRVWREARRGAVVQERYQLQQTEPKYLAELHVVRLGDMAIATNPFELYLDFGIQIKTRSPAVQTFVVELSGGRGMGYVPTARSVAGGAYGAVPASTHVGPEGGKELVNWTVDAIAAMWGEPASGGGSASD